MRTEKILLPLLLIATFVACKNSKPSASNVVATPAQLAIALPATAIHEELLEEDSNPDSVYRVIVSFISIGEGIDMRAEADLQELIVSHEKEYGVPLAHDEFRWGREGEKDICFRLLSTSKKEKDNFIDKIKEKLKGNKLVSIEENAPCRHKR